MFSKLFFYSASLFISFYFVKFGYKTIKTKKFNSKSLVWPFNKIGCQTKGGKAIAIGFVFWYLAILPLLYFLQNAYFLIGFLFGEKRSEFIKEFLLYSIIFYISVNLLKDGILAIKNKKTNIPFIDWVTIERKGMSAVYWGVIFIVASIVWFYFLTNQAIYWINFFLEK